MRDPGNLWADVLPPLAFAVALLTTLWGCLHA